MSSAWHPVPVAFGIVGFYLLLAVELSSLLGRRVPRRWWRRIHVLSFPLYVLATVHLFAAGTDAGYAVAQWTAVIVSTLVAFLTGVRVLAAAQAPRHDAPDPGGRARRRLLNATSGEPRSPADTRATTAVPPEVLHASPLPPAVRSHTASHADTRASPAPSGSSPCPAICSRPPPAVWVPRSAAPSPRRRPGRRCGSVPAPWPSAPRTSAPWPAPRASGPIAAAADPPRGYATAPDARSAATSSVAKPQSVSTSSVCWPGHAGGRWISPGVRLNRGDGAGCSKPSRSTIVSRACTWGCAAASSIVSTGAKHASVRSSTSHHSSRVLLMNSAVNRSRRSGHVDWFIWSPSGTSSVSPTRSISSA